MRTASEQDGSSSEERRHDLELVRSVASGDESRVDELVVRLACVPRFLARLNARRMRPLGPGELEDVAQETLTRIWTRLDRFQGHSRLETWLYGFCGFGLRERESADRRSREQSWDHERGGPAPWDLPVDPNEARNSDAFVLHCLERLGPPASSVIHLRLFQDLSFDAVAEALGAPTGTVKAWYYRGLDRIRDWLNASAEEVS